MSSSLYILLVNLFLKSSSFLRRNAKELSISKSDHERRDEESHKQQHNCKMAKQNSGLLPEDVSGVIQARRRFQPFGVTIVRNENREKRDTAMQQRQADQSTPSIAIRQSQEQQEIFATSSASGRFSKIKPRLRAASGGIHLFGSESRGRRGLRFGLHLLQVSCDASAARSTR